jgi:hypothetical protein
MKCVPVLTSFATKATLLYGSLFVIIIFYAVNREFGTKNFTEMAIHAPGGINHFRGMVSLFIENGGNTQNLAGAIGNAKTASLAAVFDHDHLSHFPFTTADLIGLINRIFFCFLHQFLKSPPASSDGCQATCRMDFICWMIGDFHDVPFP